ncbi:hypothetical protein CYY_001280 [Polysphondylium violaceum]|uniref:Annexin n=1 Tax=Polysphondylium violaceum TaxID=133409 RepID=A0A8J4UWD3_9MYCE|nr:hypothetical protein CYY_001280 [Polysphondylium violaceum]
MQPQSRADMEFFRNSPYDYGKITHNIHEDIEVLKGAFKGMSADETILINILGHRNWAERAEIVQEYTKKYDKDLVKEINSYTGGKLQKTLDALMTEPSIYDTIQLHEALEKKDSSAIIEILTTRTNAQKQQIQKIYMIKFSQHLDHSISSKTKGKFKDLAIALLADREASPSQSQMDKQTQPVNQQPPQQQQIPRDSPTSSSPQRPMESPQQQQLEQPQPQLALPATQQLEPSQEQSVSSMSDNSPKQVPHDQQPQQPSPQSNVSFEKESVSPRQQQSQEHIPQQYQQQQQPPMDSQDDLVTKDAHALYAAGEQKLGTDESVFIDIFSKRSLEHLRKVEDAYYRINVKRHTLFHAIEHEFINGKLKIALTDILLYATNPASYWANLFHRSLSGFFVKNTDLIRLTVTQCSNIDSIKEAYHTRYNRSLASDITHSISGSYKKVILDIVSF